jgi:hypothetical protein
LRSWIAAKSFTDPRSVLEPVSHGGQMIGCVVPLVKKKPVVDYRPRLAARIGLS